MATRKAPVRGRKSIPSDAESRPKESLYQTVARTLKQELGKGVYPVGSLLPTEAELSDRFCVGRQTIRIALRTLRDDRLVTTRQGAGTEVAPPPSADIFVLDATSINDLLAYASRAHTEILSTKMEVIADKQARRIGVDSGDEWLVVRGLARSDASALPVSYSEYYINRAFAGVSRLLQRHSGPILLLVEDMYGQRAVNIDQEITATLITPALAVHLKTPVVDEAAILLRRTFRAADKSIIQIAVHTHPASRFRHFMRIRRN